MVGYLLEWQELCSVQHLNLPERAYIYLPPPHCCYIVVFNDILPCFISIESVSSFE